MKAGHCCFVGFYTPAFCVLSPILPEKPTITCPDQVRVEAGGSVSVRIKTTGSFAPLLTASPVYGISSTAVKIINGTYTAETVWNVSGHFSNPRKFYTYIPVTWTLKHPSITCSDGKDPNVKKACRNVTAELTCTTRLLEFASKTMLFLEFRKVVISHYSIKLPHTTQFKKEISTTFRPIAIPNLRMAIGRNVDLNLRMVIGQNNLRMVIGQNNLRMVIGQNNLRMVIGQNNLRMAIGQNVDLNLRMVIGQNNLRMAIGQNNLRMVIGQNNLRMVIGQNNLRIAIGQNNLRMVIGQNVDLNLRMAIGQNVVLKHCTNLFFETSCV